MRPATADRAFGRTGEEHRRIGLLNGVRKNLVGAVDLVLEMLAAMIDAVLLQQLEQQRQCLLLHVAPPFEIEAEAVELVFAVARAEPEHEAAVAENVDEGRVLGDPHRIGERQRHHRGADLDPLGQRREIAGIDEHVRHDAVFVAEMMFRHPGIVEAELVRAQDFTRDPAHERRDAGRARYRRWDGT